MSKKPLKSFADLKSALETASKATPTTLLPGNSGQKSAPALPEARVSRRRPTPAEDIAHMRAIRLGAMAAWYTTVHEYTPREPDPAREYKGPRFQKPQPKVASRSFRSPNVSVPERRNFPGAYKGHFTV